MIYLLLCLLLTVGAEEDPIRTILKSPRQSLDFYQTFKEDHLYTYTPQEDSKRYRLFLQAARHVADYNEDTEDTGHYGVNRFSVMTREERKRFLGLNVTRVATELLEAADQAPPPRTMLQSSVKPRLLWTSRLTVTKVKDQDDCGSCWTFAAVGALETRYKLQSGVLRSFSEQEYLDCTYEMSESYDGCEGGHMVSAYLYSMNNGGRLAANKDYPYANKDRGCKGRSTPDAMVSSKIVSYRKVGSTERDHIAELQNGAIAVCLEVTDKFFAYDGSIMKDSTCQPEPDVNHGVTLVGYTELFVLIKNSWGRDWGDRGFVRLARNHNNCNLYYSSYYLS